MAVMQTHLLSMLGMGDGEREINRILPEYTAMVTDLTLGYEYGIAETYGDKFDYELIPNGVRVKTGACWAYGYAGFNQTSRDFTFSVTSGTSRYMFIAVEFDLSGAAVEGTTVEACNLVCYDNGSGEQFNFQRDNLRTNPTGRYQIPLYRVTVGASGITTESIRDDRVDAIRGKVKNAERADAAGVCDGTVNGTATIKAGAKIESGVTAVKQPKNNRTANIATTSYVMEAIDDVKNITSAPVQIVDRDGNVYSAGAVKRQVNFVYANLSWTWTKNCGFFVGHAIANLPVSFRPKTDIRAAIYADSNAGYDTKGAYLVTIKPNGNIVFDVSHLGKGYSETSENYLQLCFGFEITGG